MCKATVRVTSFGAQIVVVNFYIFYTFDTFLYFDTFFFMSEARFHVINPSLSRGGKFTYFGFRLYDTAYPSNLGWP